MSKKTIFILPKGQYGIQEFETRSLVKPGWKLLKVCDKDMIPVINPKTGRQLVEFFAANKVILKK